MKKSIALAFIFIVMCFSSFSQKKKTMFLDNIDTICNNTKVIYSVKVKNFTNIAGFQGTIKWDSTLLRIDSVFFNPNGGPIQLADTNVNLKIKNSTLSYLWYDTTFLGVTVPDSTTIISFRFNVISARGSTTPIYFINKPTKLEIDTVDINGIPSISDDTLYINGKIQFVDTPIIVQNGNTLTCEASCSPTSYQWFINGVLLPNDTTKTITIPSGTPKNPYTVTVYYSNGNSVSSTYNGTSLPLQLISFKGSLTKNKPLLTWTTSKELYQNVFYLERRQANSEFVTVSTIPSKNNSISNNEYSYLDKTAVGSNVYRLKIVDNLGFVQYSNEVTLTANNNESSVFVYPNPASKFLKVEGNRISSIAISDNYGRKVFEKQIANTTNSIETISIEKLTKGIYFVTVRLIEGGTTTEKIIVE